MRDVAASRSLDFALVRHAPDIGPIIELLDGSLGAGIAVAAMGTGAQRRAEGDRPPEASKEGFVVLSDRIDDDRLEAFEETVYRPVGRSSAAGG